MIQFNLGTIKIPEGAQGDHSRKNIFKDGYYKYMRSVTS